MYQELWKVSLEAAIWAKTSGHLRGVQEENGTPLHLTENGPPAGEILTCMSVKINKVSPASMFIASQTSES